MKYRLLSGSEGDRKFMLVFERGEDFLPELQRFLETQRVHSAALQGIGALLQATVAFYSLDKKSYDPHEVGLSEVLSVTGNVTLYEGKPRIHIHAALSRHDGTAVGGHLMSATVGATLEVTVQEMGEALHRIDNPDIGLALIDLS